MARLALLSDIHGNYKALEAFLAYIDKNPVDGIICLGDYVTDAPYPERTLALLHEMERQHRCIMLRGNREDYLINNRDNHENWKPSSANGTLFYTQQHVAEEELQYFEAMPTERELVLPGWPIMYLCHGTPGRVRGNVEEQEGLLQSVMEKLLYQYLCGGHSHHQEICSVCGKTYVNPGSLGMCIDGVGRRAQFAIMTNVSENDVRIQPMSIPYDVDGYLQDFEKSGVDTYGMTLVKAIKKSLTTGVNYFLRCIVDIEAVAEQKSDRDATRIPQVSDIPESEWQKLEEKYGL